MNEIHSLDFTNCHGVESSFKTSIDPSACDNATPLASFPRCMFFTKSIERTSSVMGVCPNLTTPPIPQIRHLLPKSLVFPPHCLPSTSRDARTPHSQSHVSTSLPRECSARSPSQVSETTSPSPPLVY